MKVFLSWAFICLLATTASAQPISFGPNTISTQVAQEVEAALAAAESPEEAARRFSKIASPIIAQAAAEILKQVLEKSAQTKPAVLSKIDGWQAIVAAAGVRMDLRWPSPGILPMSTLKEQWVYSSPSGVSFGTSSGIAPSSINWSVGVSVGGSF